jgi:hypothetical protein
MDSYAVADPQIEELLDMETGEYLNASDVIGTDYGRVMRLRLELRMDIAADTPRYGCAWCGVPVYLVRMAHIERFFFRHQLEDGRCLAQSRGQLSEAQILARKYDGAKESRRHKQMKEWIKCSLAADPSFSDIQTEVAWTSSETGRWRRPDVRARYGNLLVAFEVQLSTTFIRVIAERRQFYLGEGGLLFWVFGHFDEADRRLTEDDIFYNNNRNAFVVSAPTADASMQARKFRLDCYWADPTQPESASLRYQRVDFSQLTLEGKSQRAFFFDYDRHVAELNAQVRAQRLAKEAPLRDRFDTFWFAYIIEESHDDKTWRQLRRDLSMCGVLLPRHPGQISQPQLLNALYSAREGRPVGFRYSKLVEVAHWTYAKHKGYLRTFRHALKVYGRADQIKMEDQTGKWRRKVIAYKPKIAANHPDYAPMIPYPELISLLFPELQ